MIKNQLVRFRVRPSFVYPIEAARALGIVGDGALAAAGAAVAGPAVGIGALKMLGFGGCHRLVITSVGPCWF